MLHPVIFLRDHVHGFTRAIDLTPQQPAVPGAINPKHIRNFCLIFIPCSMPER
jgi:hypothetical protein